MKVAQEEWPLDKRYIHLNSKRETHVQKHFNGSKNRNPKRNLLKTFRVQFLKFKFALHFVGS